MLQQTFMVFKNKLNVSFSSASQSCTTLCWSLSQNNMIIWAMRFLIVIWENGKKREKKNQRYEYFLKVLHVNIPIWMLFVCDWNSFKDKQQTQDLFLFIFLIMNNIQPVSCFLSAHSWFFSSFVSKCWRWKALHWQKHNKHSSRSSSAHYSSLERDGLRRKQIKGSWPVICCRAHLLCARILSVATMCYWCLV